MTRKCIRPLLIAAAVLGFAACSEEQQIAANQAAGMAGVVGPSETIIIKRDGLTGRYFVLDQVDGMPVDFGDIHPDLHFSDDFRLTGGICNRYMGPGSLQGTLLKAQLASTMMLCVNDKLNELEQVFFRSLQTGVETTTEGGNLVLRTPEVTFVFRPANLPAGYPGGVTPGYPAMPGAMPGAVPVVPGTVPGTMPIAPY